MAPWVEKDVENMNPWYRFLAQLLSLLVMILGLWWMLPPATR